MLLALAILFLFALFRINQVRSQYPYERGAEWICSEPAFTLSYGKDSRGVLTQSEVLQYKDTVLKVDIGFQGNQYCVYPEGAADYSSRLFRGTWKYRRGDLVLIIKEDYLFGGKYTELVFSCTKFGDQS